MTGRDARQEATEKSSCLPQRDGKTDLKFLEVSLSRLNDVKLLGTRVHVK